MDRGSGAHTQEGGPSGERLWFWVILALGLALRSIDLFDDWSGLGFKSAFGTYTTGLFARNFHEHGFLESGLMPYYWRVELADGEVLRQWYSHHPVFYALLTGFSTKLLGVTAFAIQLPWLLVSLVSMVAVQRLARAWFGPTIGLWAHLVYACVPLSAWYATLPYTDAAVITVFCGIVAAQARWLRDGGRRWALASAGLVFVGGLLDWPAAFVLPGIGLHALWVARARRSWAPVGVVVGHAVGLAAAIVLHRVHMLLVLPTHEVSQDTSQTLTGVMRMPAPILEFLRRQVHHAELHLTWPVIGLTLLGTWLLLRAKRISTEVRMLTLCLAAPGPIYVAIFPGRSINHDFFLFMSLPFIAIAAAFTLRAAASGAAKLLFAGSVRAASAVLALALVAVTGQRMVELDRAYADPGLSAVVEQPWLAELLQNPDAVLLVAAGKGLNLPVYSRAPIVFEVGTVDQLRVWQERIDQNLQPDRPAVFLLDGLAAQAFPELRAELIATAPMELRDEVEGHEFAVFDLRGSLGD